MATLPKPVGSRRGGGAKRHQKPSGSPSALADASISFVAFVILTAVGLWILPLQWSWWLFLLLYVGALLLGSTVASLLTGRLVQTSHEQKRSKS